MESLLTRPYRFLLIQAAAFWPVWQWYVRRLTDGSDEPWGLVALVTAVVLFCRSSTEQHLRSQWIVHAGLMLLYAAAYPFVPKLVLAAIAVSSLACTASVLRCGTWIHVPTLGLCLLSLPLMPSLQFYLGYPLRIVSGTVAALFLHLSGIPVIQEGTCLRWGTELVSIDAPCSGLSMLWVCVYLALAMAGLLGLNAWRSFSLLITALAITILGNALRSAALFHLETGILQMPAWCHDAVGLVVFAAVAMVIAWLSVQLSRRVPCSVRGSS